MKIVALIENTTENESLKAEHGLSLYIETKEHKILFDMGQTDAFCENASALGVDIAEVDIAVLSHGHYDHGGGLAKFLEQNSKAPVFVHKDAFLPHYNGTDKYIGLDTSIKENPRIVLTQGTCHPDSHLVLFDCNEKDKRHDSVPSGLCEKVGDSFVPDDFRHEQYLLIEEEGKKVLFSGCSHKGILDIAEWFSPDALVGGFHYSKLPLDSDLEQKALELAKHPTDFYTCHCTGMEQYEFMKKYMPRLEYLASGKTIYI